MSLAPCADAAVCYKNSDNSTLHTNFSTENHKDQAIDTCSPFCVCACCNTPSVMKQVKLIANIPVTITSKHADLQVKKLTSSPISIWQPPKLG